MWLLTYDDEKFSLTEAVDKYSVGVPPSLWLPWIPQLLTCLGRNEGKYIVNLISQVRSCNTRLLFSVKKVLLVADLLISLVKIMEEM